MEETGLLISNAPLIAAFIALLGVIITQIWQSIETKRHNRLERQTKIRHELWKVKYDAYTDALDLVKQRYYSLEWKSGDMEHQFGGDPPSAKHYGRVYARLRLLTDHPELVGVFLRALGVEPQEDGSISNIDFENFNHFDRLVRLMRQDLNALDDPTPKKEFALIEFHKTGKSHRQDNNGKEKELYTL
ncbi:MAG: hypothetical protein LAT57_05475 [Balneolales bacterium]|nr:hypothetical protein [Balneolales bacterium]